MERNNNLEDIHENSNELSSPDKSDLKLGFKLSSDQPPNW